MSVLNNLIKDDHKKTVEPFNLVGRRAQIYSKEEAAKILKDNSYYIFIAAALPLIGSLLVKSANLNISIIYLISVGIYYFLLGFAIRKLKSRIASILALASFCYLIILRILENDIGGYFFFTFIFLAAAFRAVKASFFYHKKA